MNRKSFTAQEANQTLPLVQRVVEDLVRTYRILSERAAESKVLRSSEEPEDAERVEVLTRETDALAAEIEEFVNELSEVGCEVKDLRNGVVDFPARLDGRRVLLCWRLGEERVDHWHEMTEGFAARRPLPLGVRS